MKKICVLLLLLFCFVFPESVISSELESDETLLLYNTIGTYNPKNKEWDIQLHAQVLEEERDSIIRNQFVSSIEATLEISDEQEQKILKERLLYFLADNHRGKRITLSLGEFNCKMPRTKPDGHTFWNLIINKSKLKNIATDDSASVPYSFLISKSDGKSISARVFLLHPGSRAIITDIDDTIKISDVRNKETLLKNTFLKPFSAVPGMATRYRQSGLPVLYVSASPWQLYSALHSFILSEKFPDGAFFMKFFRIKGGDITSLGKSPLEYKIETISRIIERAPGVQFYLVGDNGEKDPEAYAALAKKFPGRISGIYIRKAYDDPADRYSELVKDLPAGFLKVFKSSDELSFK